MPVLSQEPAVRNPARRRRAWPIVLAAVGVMLAAGVAWAIYVGPDSLTQFALQQLEEGLNRKIDVGQAHLQLLPHPLLQVHDLVVHDRDPSRTILKAKHVALSLRVFPLLKKKVVAKRLRLERPQLELRRDHTGQWNFLSPEHETPTQGETMPDLLTMLLWVQETTVVDGALTLIDEFHENGVRTLQINGLDAGLTVPPRARHADLRLSATIPSPQTATSLTIAGRMTLTDSTVRIGRESPVAEAPIFQFEGSGELLTVDIRQLAEFLGPRPVPERLTGTANLRTTFRIAPGVNGYDVVLSDLIANVERVALSGQGNLSAIMSAQPTFAFTLSSSPAGLDELMTHFPVQWLPGDLQHVVAERGMAGTVEVVSASITGSASPEPQVSLSGEFRVTEARALLGARRIPAQHLAGTVFVEPGRIKITGLSGEYGPMQISAGRATVTYPETGAWLDLELDGNMAAVDLIATLSGTIESPRVAQALGALHEVTGETQLSYRLAGPLSGPERLTVIAAELQPRNMAFITPSLPDRVTALSGRLLLSDKGAEIRNMTVKLGALQMNIQGALTAGTYDQFQDVTIHLNGDVADLVRWYPQLFTPHTLPHGPVEAVVSLNGPVSAPQFRSSIDLKDVALSLFERINKPAGSPASLDIEGTVIQEKQVSFSRVEFLLPPFRLSGKGSVQIGPRVLVDASVASGPIVLGSLPPGSPLEGLTSGILEVSMDVKGRGPDMKTWQYNGWIALTDGTMAPKGVEAPLTNIYLRTQLVRNSADIKRLAFRIKDSDVRLSGTIKNWYTVPRIDVTIESYHFDLETLIPKGARSPVRDLLETLAADSHTTATWTIDRGLYQELVFSDLTGQAHLRDGALYVDQVAGDISGGQVNGRLAVRLPRRQPAAIDVSFHLAGVPFEKVLLLAGDETRMVTGGLTATGTLRAGGDEARGVLAGLNGKMEFAIRKGRVQKGTVLPKIIGLLNLPALLAGKVDLSRDGFPFDKITGLVTVKDGLARDDDLIVDSPIMKMSAAGTYDIPSDQLNSVVAVSPFGSYSSALKSIPLFGRIFAGERKGLLTAVFEVRGSLKNPEVTYRPIDSLATGLGGLALSAIDVLKNTLTLPFDLMSPDGVTPAPGAAPSIMERERMPDAPVPVAP